MIEIDIRLTLDELNVCLLGLGKLPLESSVQVWAKLKQAGEVAIKAAQPRPVDPQPVEPEKTP